MSRAERFRRICSVFETAVTIEDPNRRAAFVHHACCVDPGIEGEVLQLLDLHDDDPTDRLTVRVRAAIAQAMEELSS